MDDIEHLKELMLEMFMSRDKAIDLARIAMGNRLDSMNEFRDQLREQAGKFITRAEHEMMRGIIEKNENKIGLLMTRIASLEAKILIGGSGVLIVLSVVQMILFYHVVG